MCGGFRLRFGCWEFERVSRALGSMVQRAWLLRVPGLGVSGGRVRVLGFRFNIWSCGATVKKLSPELPKASISHL